MNFKMFQEQDRERERERNSKSIKSNTCWFQHEFEKLLKESVHFIKFHDDVFVLILLKPVMSFQVTSGTTNYITSVVSMFFHIKVDTSRTRIPE